MNLDETVGVREISPMSDPSCPDDFLLTPVVQSRNCGTPANLLSGCPDTEYPVVVSQAAVPATGNTVTLSVNPATAFTPGMWVTIACGQGQAPFTGKIEGVTVTEIVVRNAMADGAEILRNPPAGTTIAQCGAVAISAEPNNTHEDPVRRCTGDMAVPVPGEIVGLQGLTRGDTVGESRKCQRFLHRVGASPDTFWAKSMPGVTPAQEQEFRYVVWDAMAEGGLLKRVSKNGNSLAFMRIGAGGNASYTDNLDGATVADMPALGLPAGASLMFWDPATKVFYRVPPTNGMTVVGENGSWVVKSNISAFTPVVGDVRVFTQTHGAQPYDQTATVDLTGVPGYSPSHRQVLLFVYMNGTVNGLDYIAHVLVNGKIVAGIHPTSAYQSDMDTNQVWATINPNGTITVSVDNVSSNNASGHVGSTIYVRVDAFML
jgi:hypothetical protein